MVWTYEPAPSHGGLEAGGHGCGMNWGQGYSDRDLRINEAQRECALKHRQAHPSGGPSIARAFLAAASPASQPVENAIWRL